MFNYTTSIDLLSENPEYQKLVKTMKDEGLIMKNTYVSQDQTGKQMVKTYSEDHEDVNKRRKKMFVEMEKQGTVQLKKTLKQKIAHQQSELRKSMNEQTLSAVSQEFKVYESTGQKEQQRDEVEEVNKLILDEKIKQQEDVQVLPQVVVPTEKPQKVKMTFEDEVIEVDQKKNDKKNESMQHTKVDQILQQQLQQQSGISSEELQELYEQHLIVYRKPFVDQQKQYSIRELGASQEVSPTELQQQEYVNLGPYRDSRSSLYAQCQFQPQIQSYGASSSPVKQRSKLQLQQEIQLSDGGLLNVDIEEQKVLMDSLQSNKQQQSVSPLNAEYQQQFPAIIGSSPLVEFDSEGLKLGSQKMQQQLLNLESQTVSAFSSDVFTTN